MKHKSILALSLFPLLLVSCANQGGEDYDVANPYAAPDYDDVTGIPTLPSDVNPAYEQPAVYEDTTPAYTPPAYTPPSAPAATAKVHTVVRGDSLWSLSKKYGVSIDSIKQANGMTRDIVVLGSKLKIPAQ
jgi:LysM repeat protein